MRAIPTCMWVGRACGSAVQRRTEASEDEGALVVHSIDGLEHGPVLRRRPKGGKGGVGRQDREAVERAVCASRRVRCAHTLPRRALPLPQTETKVVEAVHMRFAQIEMVTNRCKHACESAWPVRAWGRGLCGVGGQVRAPSGRRRRCGGDRSRRTRSSRSPRARHSAFRLH